MSQHLEVVIVLDVTALDQGDLAINNREFGMESAKDRPVEIDHFQIDIGDFLG